MKKLLTFSMAMLILFQSLRGGIVYLSLKLNQDEIAANYCVAKDITMCYGSCYIEKEVKKTEQESQKSPLKDLTQKIEIWLINQPLLSIDVLPILTKNFKISNNFEYQSKLIVHSFLDDIFQPPQFIAS